MANSTLTTPVSTQPSINALKEPFRKVMIEASNKIKTKLNSEPSQNPTTVSLLDTLLPAFDPSQITDRELLKLCQQYGNNSRAWKRKFEELLPEVLKRHLYKGRKFTSIYEFAAKLCGLSHDSVDNVIRIYRQLEDKPILRSLIVEYGWSKLRIIAGIATPETDASWAEKVRVLPSSSLVVFVRDLRGQEERRKIENGQTNDQAEITQAIHQSGNNGTEINQSFNESENATIATLESTKQDKSTDQRSLSHHQSLIRPLFGAENLQFTENHGQTNMCLPARLPAQFAHPNLLTTTGEHYENSWTAISLKLNPETEFRLRKLKSRIEKGKKEKISFNQLFETMLNIVENKEVIVKKRKNPYGMVPLKLRRIPNPDYPSFQVTKKTPIKNFAQQ